MDNHLVPSQQVRSPFSDIEPAQRLHRPTWIEAKTIDHLFNHPDLASSLILLKSPSWDTTLAIYPVSTLSANNDLVVDTHGDQPVIHTNARRIIPCKQCQVYVVCVEAKGRAAERRIVKTAVDRARELVGGRAKKISRSDLWDGLGVCTWESFGGSNEYTMALL